MKFRTRMSGIVLSMLTAGFMTSQMANAEGWRDDYTEIRLGTAASEVDEDTVKALEALTQHLSEKLGVPFMIRQATDYAAVTEALKADNLEFTRMGGANYALAYRLMGDGIEPLVLDMVKGGRGYHAVVLVRADSEYKTIEDLAGVSMAFVDPNSTSGYAAPNFFLSQQGFVPDDYFGSVVFAGSHDNSVIGLVNGQFDAASTYEFTPDNSSVTRLASRELVNPDDVRRIWISPLLANPLWVGRTNLPEDLREEFTAALLSIKEDNPEVWELLRQGRLSGYGRTSHEEYVPMIEMTEWNREQRRSN